MTAATAWGAAAGVAHASWDLRVEGLLDVAIARTAAGGPDWNGREADADTDFDTDPTVERRGRLPPSSRLRLIAVEQLPGAWKMEARLEQSFRAATGDFGPERRPQSGDRPGWFDVARTIDFSHYAWGRLRLGHQAELAREVFDLVHPWAGQTVATDNCAALLQGSCIAPAAAASEQPRETALGGRGGAIRYDAPAYGPFQLSVQATQETDRRQATLALAYVHGATLLAAAHVRQSAQAHATPIVLAQSIGRWRVHVGLTEGTNAGEARRFRFIGVTGQWGRSEWLAGVQRYTRDGQVQWTKTGLGIQQPLSHRLSVYANLARWVPPAGASGRGLDAGLRLSFR